ncbi:hypothetical protein [Burkholderia cepacia]|uniref:hypothetical protein n=1 Tax=Burkholderia cepacia TaxID=292 RepID=UPI00158F1356|nr:hypothetical protein [Burkholderia cepacia]
MRHREWLEVTAEDVLQDRAQRIPDQRPLDGYDEQTLRISSITLMHVQHNRHNVPTAYTNQLVNLRCYSAYLSVVADVRGNARH